MDEAIGRAAGDAPALSKGGESNGCHSSNVCGYGLSTNRFPEA